MAENEQPEWVPLMRKTTEEEGQLFAKEPGKRTTVRTWEVNRKALPAGHEVQAIKAILQKEFES